MATPESKIKSALDKMLKTEGVWYYSPQSGPYGTAGIPDRVAIVCGLFLGIECKANEKCEMTALQKRCKEQIENAGGKFFLVYDKATIEAVRQWVVSTRSRRQEGGSSSVGGPDVDSDDYSWVEANPWKIVGLGTTQLGEYPSVEKLRLRYSFSDTPLL